MGGAMSTFQIRCMNTSSRVMKNKPRLQAAQKDLRAEAREKSASGGVLSAYVVARRSSATKDMSLFQQPASFPMNCSSPHEARGLLIFSVSLEKFHNQAVGEESRTWTGVYAIKSAAIKSAG